MIPPPPAELIRSGQVMLVRSAGLLGWIIRWVTGPWNHVALIDALEPNAPILLEAKDLHGVCSSSWAAWIAARTVQCLLILDIPNATSGERLNALTWAYQHVKKGTRYDVMQLLGIYLRHRLPFLTPTRTILDSKSKMICSEYAARAWESAGYSVAPSGIDVSILDPSMLETGTTLVPICTWGRETGWVHATV